jgi:hypothetical protein
MDNPHVTEKPHVTPSDIVAALLFLTRQKYLSTDAQSLHRALYVAREFSPLLGMFGFKEGVYPLSRSFDEALGILKLSRVVRTENTDYDRYIMEEDARRYIETRILPRFRRDEIESLSRAADVVAQACGAENTALAH